MTKTPKIAVIWFPGQNCEDESKLVCEAASMKADIIVVNSSVDPKALEQYDGFFIGGGWSYEDRIRAGAIAAKDPIMLKIKEEAKKGKVVLGVCNGAQILVETGIIPGLKDKIQMALAPNTNPKISGYFNTWVYVKHECKKTNAFNLVGVAEVLHIPVAHGEGRFTTTDKDLIKELIKYNQIMFRYCDADGEIINEYPINPNGAEYNIAGITNKEGNVLAIMPHPERASWNRQLPYFEQHSFEENEKAAPCMKIFESIRMYLERKIK